MAQRSWTAGFSRHSPPQAGGGANLITRDAAHVRNAKTQFSRVAGRVRAPKEGWRHGVTPNMPPGPWHAR